MRLRHSVSAMLPIATPRYRVCSRDRTYTLHTVTGVTIGLAPRNASKHRRHDEQRRAPAIRRSNPKQSSPPALPRLSKAQPKPTEPNTVPPVTPISIARNVTPALEHAIALQEAASAVTGVFFPPDMVKRIMNRHRPVCYMCSLMVPEDCDRY